MQEEINGVLKELEQFRMSLLRYVEYDFNDDYFY